MKIKTTELIGPALGWAVAQIEKPKSLTRADLKYQVERYNAIVFHNGEKYIPYENWAQGGPIIDRGDIGIIRQHLKSTRRCAYYHTPDGAEYYFYGPTLLIAGMRCYVASKLGDEVDVPEELK